MSIIVRQFGKGAVRVSASEIVKEHELEIYVAVLTSSLPEDLVASDATAR